MKALPHFKSEDRQAQSFNYDESSLSFQENKH